VRWDTHFDHGYPRRSLRHRKSRRVRASSSAPRNSSSALTIHSGKYATPEKELIVMGLQGRLKIESGQRANSVGEGAPKGRNTSVFVQRRRTN
jgi:hypothetical protein